MRVLNLYAGLGGNRKLWSDVDVMAVELDEKIAGVYKSNFPQDEIVIGDAHQYLLDHYQEFDFIWSSPPCQSHSRMIRSGKNRKPRYPDMKLYEEIIFLKYNHSGLWLVENVIPYYEPLIEGKIMGRHLIWSNFDLPEMVIESPKNFINETNLNGAEKMKQWLGIQYEGSIYYDGNHDPAQVLRNCVHPEIGKSILECARM